MTTTHLRWTNSSVQNFARHGIDPVVTMESKARSITLSAIDKGWSGPPYDPIHLAEILGYDVEARSDVKDARVRVQESGKFKIEFNPMRPQGRIYFSVAHEIAHTFFPDCKNRVRYRGAHEALQPDDWQIELLCNVGAAELLMPVGSLSVLRKTRNSVEELLDRRKEFQVSTEALLIRYTKLSESACAAFSASQILSGRNEGCYRLDYLIPSRSWTRHISAGSVFGKRTPVTECVAIGFTAKGKETGLDKRPLMVEAVGLPPYPGQLVPRVAGLLWELHEHPLPAKSITYIRGNALEPRGTGNRIVAHIINDKTTNWGGRSFAVAAKKKWPEAHRAFIEKVMASNRKLLKLGAVTSVPVTNDITLFNMVAQYGFGPSPSPRIRYLALRSALEKLAKEAKNKGCSVHMPRIGTGNARGQWEIIEEIVNETLVDCDIPVTVYDLP